MPSYFYHIALELIPYQLPALRSTSPNSDRHTRPSLSFESAREALAPFQKRRQQKSPVRSWRQSGHDRSRRGGSPTSDSGSPGQQHPSDSAALHRGGENRCLNPGEANPQPRPSIDSISSLPPSSIGPSFDIEKDLRFDKISIESIDMVAVEQNAAQSKRAYKNGDGNNAITMGIGTDILGGLHTKGRYIPLDEKSSDSLWGIVHLYRDSKETPSLIVDDYPSYLKGSSAARQPMDQLGSGSKYDSVPEKSSQPQLDEDCTTLCVLAVPSYLSPSDFLGFIGEATRDDVSHFRMIRTARANRYMVLMKFRNGKKAREWQKEWNGKVFNSMEPETCHVVFVMTVEIQAANVDSESDLPETIKEPLSTNPPRARAASASQSVSLNSASLSTKPLAPPTPSLIELPTCPVCLERMDETTGLLTIICQHVFHCTCLQKWKGSGCPVCRYTLDDFGRRSQGLDPSEGPNECCVCQSELNLWICLICGNVGCGRYDGAHAFAHFKQTSHTFAMDLATQRVWDYISDGYVHRIIQNKSDGKLVELPAAGNSALDPPDWTDAVPREKLENISVEYTHLLTSQLESQRAYFEEIVERAADKASKASVAASSAQETAEKATANLLTLQQQYDSIINETVSHLERDKDRAERRAERFEAMSRKMEKEWKEEKVMSESLMKRVEYLTEEVGNLKTVNADLGEQNRDLGFFISGMEQLKDKGEDVVEGTVSIPEGPSKRKKGKGKNK